MSGGEGWKKKEEKPFVQPTKEEVAAREHAAEMGLGGVMTQAVADDGADGSELDGMGPRRGAEGDRYGTKGFEKTPKGYMGQYKHNIEVKIGRRNMTVCWVLSLLGVIATCYLVIINVTGAAFVIPRRLPSAREFFLGYNVIYNTQSNGPFLDSAGSAFGLVLPLYLLVVVSVWTAYHRLNRIRLRDMDVGLWSDRDTRTVQLKGARAFLVLVAAIIWWAVVETAQAPTIRDETFLNKCRLEATFSSTVPDPYSAVALPREFDAMLGDDCRRSFFHTVRADEEKFRGAAKDDGYEKIGFADNGTMIMFAEPVGRSRYCSLVRSYDAMTIGTATLRECFGGLGFDVSNWYTFANSEDCDVSFYNRFYETTLRVGDNPHFSEQWFCRQYLEDRSTEVRIHYDTISWRRPITGSCYDFTRGDPAFLSGLQPGSRTPGFFPEIRSARVSTLSSREKSALLGHDRYIELSECRDISVSCINDTRIPTETGFDGRPTPRMWRSTALSNCTKTLPRSASVATDQEMLDFFVHGNVVAYGAALSAAAAELGFDLLESAFWVCLF